MKTLYLPLFAIIATLIFSHHSMAEPVGSVEKQAPPPKTYFLATYMPTEKWKTTWIEKKGAIKSVLPEQLMTLNAHFGYVHKSHSDEQLISGGPTFTKGEIPDAKYVDGAMLIFATSSYEQTKVLIEQDPLISTGLMKIDTLKPFIAGVPFK